MKEGVLYLAVSKRMTLTLFVALLVGMGAFLGLDVRTAETKPSPTKKTYEVQDLGTLGGTYSQASDISASGKVVGLASNGSEPPEYGGYSARAFLYDNGANPQMKNLGTLGGPWSTAYGISDSGKVVGSASVYDEHVDYYHHAFLYDEDANPQMKDLGTLGGYYSVANSVNNSGKVVGWAANSADDYYAFLYDEDANPQMKNLGSFGGIYSEANDVNEFDKVVGGAAYAGGTTHAFLYDEDANPQMKDLGTLPGGRFSFARGINNSGKVVGVSSLDGSSFFHAFLYDEDANPQMKALGTLGGHNSSIANDINDAGEIVGQSYNYSSSTPWLYGAFVYKNGQMIDLNALIPEDSGWIIYSAEAINNKGQIAAYGFKPEAGESPFRVQGYFRRHALLLTPRLG